MRQWACMVHGGAGNWRPEREAAALRGCRAAVEAAREVLRRGGAALEAVVAAVRVLEDNPEFNAGCGSVRTQEGTVEMDAAVMDGANLRAGGVAAVQRVRHPIELAARVLDAGLEVLLVGEPADRWAQAVGLELVAPSQGAGGEDSGDRTNSAAPGGTVGAVACDTDGNVAAATSTGGRKGKRSGRVGDSPVLGAGTYADNRGGAASATGDGEAILRFGLTRFAVLELERGVSPTVVASASIAEMCRRVSGEVGLILVDRFGRLGCAHNTAHMPVAWVTASQTDIEASMAPRRLRFPR